MPEPSRLQLCGSVDQAGNSPTPPPPPPLFLLCSDLNDLKLAQSFRFILMFLLLSTLTAGLEGLGRLTVSLITVYLRLSRTSEKPAALSNLDSFYLSEAFL